ncbi:MAG TPA: DUF1549 domain-containing protein [Pirellulales bacterium]|jgi:hypothetical protein|nr:DUF1549 domain-containing protein [Pirellulales bacterium]
MLSSRRLISAGLLLLATCGSAWAGGIDARAAARQIDELLAKEAYGGSADSQAAPVARADDETFLRRLALDLVGRPPTPEEVTAFALDNAADKRDKAVDRLLAHSEFGENWARYWRDVIMYRRSEDRALLVSPTLVTFLAKAFNENAHWDAIARKFITATGDVREAGETAIIMAQNGNAEDTTAEVSRIFLGIQIQCAQCHNHPTDRWKREQFHELAAFFPRIAVRPVRDGEMRSFAVVSVDRGGRDKDKAKPRRGALEHHMPDLNHPDQEGKLMKPVFFVTGQHLESGLSDKARREKLADWFTGRNNRWFARAYVNRMWSELVGHGFYEPVDDIGPDRAASAPHTLDYLADHFAGAQYDVKWLFRAITATEAYQRDSRSRASSEATPFVACATQRLRADQLFNTLMVALGVEEGGPPRRDRNPRAMLATPRGRMNATFGYDPSNRRDEVAGSIPQALMLMNAPELNRAIKASEPGSMLSQLLTQLPKDEALIDELYLRCLAREPSARERETCLAHVAVTRQRAEAFEDIVWSLVNSTEFLNRK